MKNTIKLSLIISLIFLTSIAMAEDNREFVKLPSMMQNHMMANMRDHLVAINEIQIYLANDQMDKAAEVAENRLGMSSMDYTRQNT